MTKSQSVGLEPLDASPRSVGILLFPEVEVLDFAGPFEVFSVTGQREGEGQFRVFTVSEDGEPVRARNGLRVLPDHSFADCPPPDILLIPGGYGTRPLIEDPKVLGWIRAADERTQMTLSVCTGSLLLGKAGILDGLNATTHWAALDLLEKHAPAATLQPDARVVDNGRVVVSAGVAAGIDMSLHVVARLLGRDAAAETARYMDYPWTPQPGFDYGAQ